MQEVLNELFYGNIRLSEKQFIHDCEERLMTLLSGKELELFEKLMKAQEDSKNINRREKFMAGFRLMQESRWKSWNKNDGCTIDIID